MAWSRRNWRHGGRQADHHLAPRACVMVTNCFCLTGVVVTPVDMLALPADQLLEPCNVFGDTATWMPVQTVKCKHQDHCSTSILQAKHADDCAVTKP